MIAEDALAQQKTNREFYLLKLYLSSLESKSGPKKLRSQIRQKDSGSDLDEQQPKIFRKLKTLPGRKKKIF